MKNYKLTVLLLSIVLFFIGFEACNYTKKTTTEVKNETENEIDYEQPIVDDNYDPINDVLLKDTLNCVPNLGPLEYMPKGNFINHIQNYALINDTIIIPVVVHVVAPSVNDVSNISDRQVLQGIELTNEMIANIPEGLPYQVKAIAATGRFKLAMAKFDPDGKPRNGINRIIDERSNFGYDEGPSVSEEYRWSGYFNFFIFKRIATAGGIAWFPSQVETYGTKYFAAFVKYNQWGSIETAEGNLYDNTILHELYHALYGHHTNGTYWHPDNPISWKFDCFGSENCEDCLDQCKEFECHIDDFCKDTPNHRYLLQDCQRSDMECSGNEYDYEIIKHNVIGYHWCAERTSTADQIERYHNTFLNYPHWAAIISESNLDFTLGAGFGEVQSPGNRGCDHHSLLLDFGYLLENGGRYGDWKVLTYYIGPLNDYLYIDDGSKGFLIKTTGWYKGIEIEEVCSDVSNGSCLRLIDVLLDNGFFIERCMWSTPDNNGESIIAAEINIAFRAN